MGTQAFHCTQANHYYNKIVKKTIIETRYGPQYGISVFLILGY
jgi:hypothetical protein